MDSERTALDHAFEFGGHGSVRGKVFLRLKKRQHCISPVARMPLLFVTMAFC